jgi:Rieske Fe-S protein
MADDFKSNEEILDLTWLKKNGPEVLMRVKTKGRPVWIVYRSSESTEIIEKRKHITYKQDPTMINPGYRSVYKDLFVVFGGCPEGPELPAYYPEKGFVCLSTCAEFDMAGRPMNECAGEKPMDIPIHYFKNEETIVVPTNQDGNT